MELTNGSVPVAVAARIFQRDATWVRAGIIQGWLDIGFATRDKKLVYDVCCMHDGKGRISYYISPKKLYDLTGYEWKGEKK